MTNYFQISLAIFGICINMVSAIAQGKNDQPRPRLQVAVYTETFGHNAFGYNEDRGILSLNAACRLKLNRAPLAFMLSSGWGMFKTFQRSKPSRYGRVHYIPLEATIQVGGKGHFVEIGFCLTPAFGEQLYVYEGGVAVGPDPERWVFHDYAIQYIPRIGYSYYGKRGMIIRAAYTPHFYSKKLERDQGYFLVKPLWIPVGLSLGWFIRK